LPSLLCFLLLFLKRSRFTGVQERTSVSKVRDDSCGSLDEMLAFDNHYLVAVVLRDKLE
jgi:hypothetical protein